MRRYPLALILFLCCVSTAAFAQELLGQRFKFTGRWRDQGLEVSRTQARDPRQDAQNGRISGTIDTLDTAGHALTLGSLRIVWDDTSRFTNLASNALASGKAIEVVGRLEAAGYFQATTIEAIATTDSVELLGTVTAAQRQANGAWHLTVLGVSVIVPKGVDTRAIALTRRPDEDRPTNQLTVPLFGSPLTIGGSLESTARYRRNFNLEDAVNEDRMRLDQELQLEFFYRPASEIAFFFEGKPLYDATLYDGDGPQRVEYRVERGETWLYVNSILQSNFSLQLGRQNFRETREWWWDDDLDAVRLYYDRASFHFELGLAQELATVSTETPRVAPEQRDVFRLPARATWEWSRKQLIDVFFLYHHDYSRRPQLRQRVAEQREDESDAELVWFGIRLSGRGIALRRFGELTYWLDGAAVFGEETVFDFGDAEAGNCRIVTARQSRKVRGWAFDGGVVWRTRLPWRPTLTLAYAIGSGDRTLEGGTDHAFQQTGLHENNNRFGGVDRFQYYGELLSPELSNLHIWTVALGFRFLPSSSLELVYHLYRQVEPAPFLRDVRIDADPDGEHRAIGQEWDIILGIREWQRVEIEWINALFRAGSAYDSLAGKFAYTSILKITLNF